MASPRNQDVVCCGFGVQEVERIAHPAEELGVDLAAVRVGVGGEGHGVVVLEGGSPTPGRQPSS